MDSFNEIVKATNDVFNRWNDFFSGIDDDMKALETTLSKLNQMQKMVKDRASNTKEILNKLKKLGKTW